MFNGGGSPKNTFHAPQPITHAPHEPLPFPPIATAPENANANPYVFNYITEGIDAGFATEWDELRSLDSSFYQPKPMVIPPCPVQQPLVGVESGDRNQVRVSPDPIVISVYQNRLLVTLPNIESDHQINQVVVTPPKLPSPTVNRDVTDIIDATVEIDSFKKKKKRGRPKKIQRVTY